MKGKSKAELRKEVEEIRRMKTLGKILQKGDMESALLSNSSKDSEPISENVIDSMLNNLNKGNERRESTDLRMIETLTTRDGGRMVKRQTVKIRSKGRKVKRSIHIKKVKARPSRKAKSKGKRKR